MDRQIKLFLTNTLTRRKEEFIPIDPAHVTMYACGPTVYDRAHLGNARAAVIYDLLFRLLKHLYKNASYVRNITDVDDKIIHAAIANKENISDLTKRITAYYHEDMEALNCLNPTQEPRATEYIREMVAMIEDLLSKNHAYIAEGHVLFAIDSFKEYGLLSGRSTEEMIAGARVEIAPYKKNPADFVLWKPAPYEEVNFAFESPWGLGRPGWHIECSTMSKSCYGNKFDIHGGGIDLMFPHHENEIAQSYCCNGYGNFANYWVHNGFLTVEGEKMSKSLGNFKTVHDALKEGHDPMAIRYFFLTTHYRKPLDFNKKALEDSKKAIEKFKLIKDLHVSEVKSLDHYCIDFLEALADDMNTPIAIAKLHEYASAILSGKNDCKLAFLFGLKTLGLQILPNVSIEVPEYVKALLILRNSAKGLKNWSQADALREQIKKSGYIIIDNKDGSTKLTIDI